MKKTIVTSLLLLLAFLGSTAFIMKYTNGIAGWTGSPGEGYCNNCHSGGSSPSSNITISSTPAFSVNQFVPGTTYTINIQVAASGFNKFGFDSEILDASNINAGSIQSLGGGVTLQLFSGKRNAVHNAPKSGQGVVNFTFKWIAPTVGDTATIFASANAVNGDGNTTGDFPLDPVFMQLSAQQQQPPDTSDVGIKELNLTPALAVSLYPNPAVGVTSIAYDLNSSQQTAVQLIDLYGKRIKEFINEKEMPGPHAHLLGLQGVNPGIYFVKLSGNGVRIFQSMLVVN